MHHLLKSFYFQRLMIWEYLDMTFQCKATILNTFFRLYAKGSCDLQCLFTPQLCDCSLNESLLKKQRKKSQSIFPISIIGM